MEQQSNIWRSRGILSQHPDFERAAKQWVAHFSTLEKVKQHFDRPIHITALTENNTYRGQIVAMGTLDKEGTTHLVLSRKGILSAFEIRQKPLMTLKVGQSIKVSRTQIRENHHAWKIQPINEHHRTRQRKQ